MPEKPEFSHPVPVASLEAGDAVSDAADAATLVALARRFDVPAVRALSFTARAAPWGPGGWRVSGVVDAAFTQTCVVTLEPVDTALTESFERFFAPPARMAEAEALFHADAEEAPEPLAEAIDFGEIAAETAALALDPYPRKAGVDFGGALTAPPGVAPMTDEDARPFAGLAALRGRNDEN